MIEQIVLLSGPISSGKTTLAAGLAEKYGFEWLKTRALIAELTGAEGRAELQKAGEKLDKQTGGRWIVDHLTRELSTYKSGTRLLVDAVRVRSQAEAIREALGRRVLHVHFDGKLHDFAKRFRKQASKGAGESYEDARNDPTELQVDSLRDTADLVINTSEADPEDVLVRVAAFVGLFGRRYDPLVDVLIGGQYGSEGKGQVSAHLAPEYDLLVRVGGPNAGHKVFALPDPYTFHHLPSGTKSAENAAIVLGAGAVIWPTGLLDEIARFQVSLERLAIDPQAMVIDETDRLGEKKGVKKSIASTASGVGWATSRKILRTDAKPRVVLAQDHPDLKNFVRDTKRILQDAFAAGKRVFLEGTQGTALSVHHGDYPYVTSRDTSVGGCLAEAGIAPARVRRVVMVCRTYPIRVQNPPGGTSGPMRREISYRELARRSGLTERDLRKVERTSTTDTQRRLAEFDWVLLRKAATLNAPTDVALTFVDYIRKENRNARRFDQLTENTIRFIEEVERVAAAPVSLISTRFHSRSIIDRRNW